MVFNKVWYCGHCGTVFKEKLSSDQCCNGDAEPSYQCSECNICFNEKITDKCPECGK